MSAVRSRLRKRWRRLVLVLVTVAGFPSFAAGVPPDTSPIDRVGEIRARLLEADRSASAPDAVGPHRLGDGPSRLTQYWRNWPNHWANWPNWPNWGNWRNR